MKTLLFATSLLIFSALSFKADAVPNGDFANWITEPIMVPESWNTSDMYEFIVHEENPGSSTRSTDSYTGNYSLRLETMDLEHEPEPNAYAEQYVEVSGLDMDPDTVYLHYKFAPAVQGDMAQIIVRQRNNHGEQLDINIDYVGESSTYKMVVIPFTLHENTSTIQIRVSASVNGEVGNVMHIDNVSFKYDTSEPSNDIGLVEKFAPADSSEVNSLTPGLEWGQSNNATSYQVQVSSSTEFSAEFIVAEDSALTNPAYIVEAGALEYEMTYHWRVRGTSEEAVGPWSEVWTFNTPLGTNLTFESRRGSEIDIYPNPAQDVINITLPAEMANSHITVHNLQGRVVTELKDCSDNCRLDISELNKGVYLINAVNENNRFQDRLIVH